MDAIAVAAYDVADDADYMSNFSTLSDTAAPLVTTAAAAASLFSTPAWGAENEALASTAFAPGVYLHNRDAATAAAAACGYLDAADTSVGLLDWPKGVPSSSAPYMAAPRDMAEMADPEAISPILAGGRTRLSLSTSAMPSVVPAMPPMPSMPPAQAMSARVSKARAGSARSLRNSSHAPSSYSAGPRSDKLSSFSSASTSSSASPPISTSPRSARAQPATASSATAAAAAAAAARLGGLLTTGHGGNHNVTLRTASRKPKAAAGTFSRAAAPSAHARRRGSAVVPKTESPKSESSESSPSSHDPADAAPVESLTSEERRARQNHNIVEKQYRGRLNSQFERLLSILPANQLEGGRDGGGGSSGGGGSGGSGGSSGDSRTAAADFGERRMSKAEVLDLARRRIHALEHEIEQLYTDRENLRNNVATLNLAIQQQNITQEQHRRMSITI